MEQCLWSMGGCSMPLWDNCPRCDNARAEGRNVVMGRRPLGNTDCAEMPNECPDGKRKTKSSKKMCAVHSLLSPYEENDKWVVYDLMIMMTPRG